MTSVLSNLISARGNVDVSTHVLSFLQPSELAVVEKTNRAWREIAASCWEEQATTHDMIPASIPPQSSLTKIFKQLYQGSFGPKVYREYIGKPSPIVPIPQEYVTAGIKRDDFQLTFIPEYITIAVSKESKFMLNEIGRLIEDPGAAAYDRTIDVPVTIRNIAVLVEKCLKRGTPQKVKNILDQHGDTRVESHWFYPKKEPMGFLESFDQQQRTASQAGLEITPLIDTFIYYLLQEITSQSRDYYKVRTSTLTLDDILPHALRDVPSALKWCFGSGQCLLMQIGDHEPSIYLAAVGVPASKPAVPA